MSEPTEIRQPLENTGVRINLTTGVLIGALSALVTVAVMAGTYKNRIENVERASADNTAINRTQDMQLVELTTTNRAILQHLESIDRKMESAR